MDKEKKSSENLEKFDDWIIEVSGRYRGLKDAIMIDARKWKDGKIGNQLFETNIYKSIDEFIIEHKSRLLIYLKGLKD